MTRKAIDWLRSLDFTVLVVAALFLSDLGTTGSVWASRQAQGKAWVGWVVALSLDASAALSLRALSQAQRLSLRLYAVLAFLVACGIPASFGTMYYRMTTPVDPIWFSILLGSVAPGLGALLVGLRSLVGAHQAEAQRQIDLELEKYHIEQETVRVVRTEIEKTKRERARARAIRAQVEESKAQAEMQARESKTQLDKLMSSSGKASAILAQYRDNPMQSQATVAQELSISRQAVGQHLRKLEQEGLVKRNGRGVEVLV